ncbi:alpha-galactosidase [Streptomyces sp. 110]|uniref:Alpha-galactosidase n=1 Tax=Streptomyces endocoffeicus TaxID=2898945 RepID=A0ABS1Q2S4_9ACTN|nr:glycoside hydrolase family 36 protein [Streptomyces endocoffeicus]MBL1118967.1 alpha-galactosidase [Streptomyces endocoffeicus]
MSHATHQAVTTAELAPAACEPLLDGVSIAVAAPGADVSWDLVEEPGGPSTLWLRADGAPVEVRFSVPLGDAAGYWHPRVGWHRTLPADWAGRSVASLVGGHAAGCLYDHSGATLLTFAAVDPVPETALRFGVSEENDTYVVHVHLPASNGPHRLLLVPRAESVAAALRVLRAWFTAEVAALPVPDSARTPVYSTWYAFNQQVDAVSVETQARLAADLGCGVLILDDGWQRHGHGRGYAGCGDWEPDGAKFPDFTAHVARVRGHGLRYLVWIAPLLLGPRAACHREWAPYATRPATVPGAAVLDPRHPEVRSRIVERCVRLVRDHGLDGLKVDFLDQAMVYAGDGAGDVGAAMALLLTDLRCALQTIRPDVLLELRQPYTGPGMAPYGNMMRSLDCPADAIANRVRTIDTSLLTVGGAVHSDMLLWDPSAPVEAAVRQLIGTLHSVPQLSVRLDRLPAAHREAIGFWLAEWRRLRPQLLDGTVEPGRPDELYPLVRSAAHGVCVIDVHSDRVVPLRPAGQQEIVLVNAGPADRLTVAAEGDARTADITVHDPRGRIIDRCRRVLTPGLHTVPVPSMGLATLRIREGGTQ